MESTPANALASSITALNEQAANAFLAAAAGGGISQEPSPGKESASSESTFTVKTTCAVASAKISGQDQQNEREGGDSGGKAGMHWIGVSWRWMTRYESVAGNTHNVGQEKESILLVSTRATRASKITSPSRSNVASPTRSTYRT